MVNQSMDIFRGKWKLPSRNLYFLGFLVLAFDQAAGETNLALGKPTSQWDTKYGGVSSLAVDGNTDGRFDEGSVTYSAGWHSTDPFWEVDLGGNFGISMINIYVRIDSCCRQRYAGMRVVILDDADVEVWSFTQPDVDHPDKIALSMAGNGDSSVVGRKVRVTNVHSNISLSLAEVEVIKNVNHLACSTCSNLYC